VSRPEQSLTRLSVSALAERMRADVGTSAALILFGPLAEA
jgi:uroporphyrin-III C-methyltransferase